MHAIVTTIEESVSSVRNHSQKSCWDAPSAVGTKFRRCVLCGENLPIGISRCIIMVHHRRPNVLDRRHGCGIIRDDVEGASKQYQVVENGKS